MNRPSPFAGESQSSIRTPSTNRLSISYAASTKRRRKRLVINTEIVEKLKMNRSDGRVLDILSDARLWSSLSHVQIRPFADVESFGYGQPGVRSYVWALLQTLLENWTGMSPTTAPLLS